MLTSSFGFIVTMGCFFSLIIASHCGRWDDAAECRVTRIVEPDSRDEPPATVKIPFMTPED